ncbi:hypothetical protein ABD74_17695 [Brevibacillus laterosporus]|nr:hypothetical protein [Brevibacillus laterosporus]
MKLSQRFIVTSFTLWFNAFFHISSYSLIEGYRLTSFQRNFLEKNKRIQKALFLPKQRRAANGYPLYLKLL